MDPIGISTEEVVSVPTRATLLARESRQRADRELNSGWRWFEPSICALAYALLFLPMLSVLRHHLGFPLDDSWIHQVVARNLADYGVIGFLPGHVSSGSTSLLWTLILAFRAALLPALSPVVFCAGVSVVLLAAIGFVLKCLSERDGHSSEYSWCTALAPAASGNLLWFGMIGMEHLLFILLSICVIMSWFDFTSRKSSVSALLLPLLCFLLVVTRPEGVCLIGLLLLFRRSADRSLRDWLVAASGAVCGGALSAAVNLITGHHLTPLTMQGRNDVMSSNGWVQLHVQFLTRAFIRMLSVWGIDMPHAVLHGRGLLLGVPLVFAVLLCIVLAVRQLLKLGSPRYVLLCAWAATIIVLYFFLLPNTGHGGRYISIPILLFLPLVFLGFHAALRLTSLSDRAGWFVVGALGVTTASLSISAWTAVAGADIEQIDTEHGEIASWIQQNIPQGSIAAGQVAVFDIGRIGYQLGGHLTDLGGLVDYRFQPYLIHGRTADYLQAKEVKYVVLPGDVLDPGSKYFSSTLWLNPAHGAELSLLHTVCADSETARLAFTSSETASACQRLYSIRYIAH